MTFEEVGTIQSEDYSSILSLFLSGDTFPFFGDAERERDLLSAEAERSLKKD